MITIIYTVGSDKTEYKDIFSKKVPLNNIVASLQKKHGTDYDYFNIYIVSTK